MGRTLLLDCLWWIQRSACHSTACDGWRSEWHLFVFLFLVKQLVPSTGSTSWFHHFFSPLCVSTAVEASRRCPETSLGSLYEGFCAWCQKHYCGHWLPEYCSRKQIPEARVDMNQVCFAESLPGEAVTSFDFAQKVDCQQMVKHRTNG